MSEPLFHVTTAVPQQRLQQTLAWGVHLFTASGVVWGLLAIMAIFQEQWVAALGWMIVATLVDSSDGVLARRFRVKEVLPGFDGELLDNMVDYFTYAVVPALFLYRAALLPPHLALIGVSLVVLASAYQFSQVNAKTEDHFFTGFPSYWNVVVFYLIMLPLTPWVNFLLVVGFSVLVFLPVRYVYQTRTRAFRRLTISLTLLWAIAALVLLATYPAEPLWLAWGSLLYPLYYASISLYLMRRLRAGRAL